MNFYSIFDKATNAYNPPFLQPTDGAAVRVIKNEMAQQDSMLGKHPHDFELWRLGKFDKDTGEINPTRERVLGLGSLVTEGDQK